MREELTLVFLPFLGPEGELSGAVRRFLTEFKLTAAMVDRIVCLGEYGRLPLVRESMDEVFRRPVIFSRQLPTVVLGDRVLTPQAKLEKEQAQVSITVINSGVARGQREKELIDLVTPDNLSTKRLIEIFEGVKIDVVLIGSDGSLEISDKCITIIKHDNLRETIRLSILYGFKVNSSLIERLRCANMINQEYIVVRAYCTDNGMLVFDHDLIIGDGITKYSLVHSVKFFNTITQAAVKEYGYNIVE